MLVGFGGYQVFSSLLLFYATGKSAGLVLAWHVLMGMSIVWIGLTVAYPFVEVPFMSVVGLVVSLLLFMVTAEIYTYVFHGLVVNVDPRVASYLVIWSMRVLVVRLILLILRSLAYRGSCLISMVPYRVWVKNAIERARHQLWAEQRKLKQLNNALTWNDRLRPYMDAYLRPRVRFPVFRPWIITRPLPRLPSITDPAFYPGKPGGIGGVIFIVVVVVVWFFGDGL